MQDLPQNITLETIEDTTEQSDEVIATQDNSQAVSMVGELLSQQAYSHAYTAETSTQKANVAMNAWLPQASYPCGKL